MLTLTLLALPASSALAQNDEASELTAETNANKGFHIDNLYLETRLGYEAEVFDGNMDKDLSGFRGKYLNLKFDGQITKGLTFSYRQRLNKNTDQTFFDATDWLHLNWRIPFGGERGLSLNIGKQVVSVGGYEYDRAPIDLYYCTEFWHNVPCYQLGGSVAYDFSSKDNLLLQVCNSPFRRYANSDGTLLGNNSVAINLLWSGHHGLWSALWSTNMMQTTNDRWINYISLGNRFDFCPEVSLEFDVMNRASSHQRLFFCDWSTVAELSVKPIPALRCFAKYAYDVNHSGTDADVLVVDGTDLHLVSVGIEGMPLKSKYRQHLRLFAIAGYNWGKNANPEACRQPKELSVQAGVKFRLDVLEGINLLVNKARKK